MKEKIIEFVDKEKRKLCFFTVIASMLIHFQLYALMITGPDTLINSMYHQADIWEAMLLRFGLDFVQMLKGNIVSPILATLISSIFLGISVILVIDILEIKKQIFKISYCISFYGGSKHICNFIIFLLLRCIYAGDAFSNYSCTYNKKI